MDFLKIIVFDKDEVQQIWNHPDLIWYDHQERLSHIDYTTIIVKETKEFKKILFCLHKNKLEILFSVHRYFNDNLHNANDFHVDTCISVLQTVFRRFGLDVLTSVKLVGMEYGINFRMQNYAPNVILHTEYWKRTKFLADDELGFSKKSYTTKNNGRANGYKIIKWYSKGVQFPKFCSRDTVRLEIKTRQSQYISKLGINTIMDLMKPSVYLEMKKELLLVGSEMLILDQTIDKKLLSENEREFLNPYTWTGHLNGYRNQFVREKEKYMDFLNRIGKNVHSLLLQNIKQKLDELFKPQVVKGADLPPKNLASKQALKGADLPPYIKQICTYTDLSKIRCRVTGLTLEHEGTIKANASIPNYIRIKTLRYLQKNDPKTFERLRLDLIPSNRSHGPKYERSILSHMAKQVRNRFYNANKVKKVGYLARAQPNEQLNMYELLGV
ncbi:hypothetical protein U1E44_01390 [Arenibacter sp. GZD96]|uniref:hypothetical protein n=1 Tax=Aurantibrevibacter litoralis TaxID=3106030 RepID=UPI002AFE0A1F|nr:hypothetical protein [Arenibacter sp. GZD-96]MEA1784732.1 hypothetical protein [Arenibacter sp. GZD-96]